MTARLVRTAQDGERFPTAPDAAVAPALLGLLERVGGGLENGGDRVEDALLRHRGDADAGREGVDLVLVRDLILAAVSRMRSAINIAPIVSVPRAMTANSAPAPA